MRATRTRYADLPSWPRREGRRHRSVTAPRRRAGAGAALASMAAACLLATGADAQNLGAAPPVLRLIVGDVVAPAGIDASLIADPGGIGGAVTHAIVQFDGPLSAEDRAAVVGDGVVLLDPVPQFAYYAAIPARLLVAGSDLASAPYRAVAPILPRYKIASSLVDGTVPPYARRGDAGVAVIVNFHGDVTADAGDELLDRLALRPEQRLPLVNGVQLELPSSQLLTLAAEDIVKWIEPITGPPEDDNDDVRSASGVASVLVAGASPYGLTGNGVIVGQWETGVADDSHGDLDDGQLTIVDNVAVTAHATHVAATIVGSGERSAANGGSPNQWQGIAVGASIRAYDSENLDAEYGDAASAGAAISTNSWGIGHCHELTSTACYRTESIRYDTVISGRNTGNLPSGLPRRLMVVASAGNKGTPERHADNVVPNQQYDPGEGIYSDEDDSGTLTAGDRYLRHGLPANMGDPLIGFKADERHTELVTEGGLFDSVVFDPMGIGEVIYRDVDRSGRVSVNDIRLSAGPSGPPGSVVEAGHADIGHYLRQFVFWGNTRASNSAKNTIVVGNYTSDAGTLHVESGRGPTPDGRLKPDLVAPGSQVGGDQGVTSAIPIDGYAVFSATSHSTPAVTGVAALLREWYARACGPADPHPSTLRAMLLHGAVDLTEIPNVAGEFVGPDYAYGYGSVDAPGAVSVVPHHVEATATPDDVGDVHAHEFRFVVGKVRDLKVTLAWDDPPWFNALVQESIGASLLHNDLDLELIAPNGTVHTPWRLNPLDPFVPAAPSAGYTGTASVPDEARDRRNTAEQIVVPDAMPGTWTIRVVVTRLDMPDQDFSIVGEFVAPGLSPCAPEAQADLWLRDSVTDDGSVPQAGQLWLSPDVWNRVQADGGTAHQNPVYGIAGNALYARIMNMGPAMAAAASVEVWIASASTGLSWPASFTYVGRLPAPNVAPGETRVVGPLLWNPPKPYPSDHFCFYVRIVSPHDALGGEGPVLPVNVGGSNSIGWRNVNVVGVSGLTSWTFLVRNVETAPASVDIEIVVPDELLDGSAIRVRLPRRLHEQWQELGVRGDGFVVEELPAALADLPGETLRHRSLTLRSPTTRLERIPFEPLQAAALGLSVDAGSSRPGDYPLDVIQYADGEVVGGIRYVLRIGRAQQ